MSTNDAKSTTVVRAKAKVLGTPIDAFFQKKSEKNREVKYDKDDGNKKVKVDVTDNKMLVFGAPDPSIALSLEDLIKQLTQLVTLGFTKSDDLLSNVPDRVQSILKGVKFSIRQLFFVKQSRVVTLSKTATLTEAKFKTALETKGTELYELANDDSLKGAEYALWIDVEVDPKLFDGFPLEVTNIGFKVWNTSNKVVLEKMGIEDDKKLLEAAGMAPAAQVTTA